MSYLGYFSIHLKKTFYTEIQTGKVKLWIFLFISLVKKHHKTTFLVKISVQKLTIFYAFDVFKKKFPTSPQHNRRNLSLSRLTQNTCKNSYIISYTDILARHQLICGLFSQVKQVKKHANDFQLEFFYVHRVEKSFFIIYMNDLKKYRYIPCTYVHKIQKVGYFHGSLSIHQFIRVSGCRSLSILYGQLGHFQISKVCTIQNPIKFFQKESFIQHFNFI